MRAWEALYPPGLRWDTPIPTTTLPAMLDLAVARYADRPAIDFRGRTLGFTELGQRVDRAAAGLLARGMKPAEPIALLLANTPAHPIAFFAILKAGGRVVHLSPLDPVRVMAKKLADSGARTLVTTNLPPVLTPALALVAEHAVERLIVFDDIEWGPSPAVPMPEGALPWSALDASVPVWPVIHEADVALLQFTGGTTGQPRAAMLTHANLTAATAIYDLFSAAIGRAYEPTDRIMCVLPLFHIYALTAVLFRAITAGTVLLLRPRFDPAAMLDDIEAGCTHFNGVPTMFIALLNQPGAAQRNWSSLKNVSSGGAGMPHEVGQQFTALTHLRIGGGWGMTETSPAGTNLWPDRPQEPGEIGIPLPGIDMEIVALDDPRRVLAPGETGEIRVRGPNVTPGYYNRPAENETAFVDGWFLTGDIGRMGADGSFFLVDRKKEMIISGGFNVYPRVIEDAIYEHPDIREAAVIGVADPYRGHAAKAFVSLRAGAAPLTLDGLRAFLADKLGRHEMPSALEIRDELPHTPVGKLAKRELETHP